MTAIDEISVRTPDALFNGTAVRDLIASCVPNIKNPWLINSVDLDAILLAIKAASGQENLEVESTCPECTTKSEFVIALAPIIASIKSGDYESELVINGEVTIKFRPLTYKEMSDAALKQFNLQKQFIEIEKTDDDAVREKLGKAAVESVTITTMEVIADTIEHINAGDLKVSEKEFILDFLKNCDKNIFAKIRDHNTNLRKETELKPLSIECTNCGHKYEQAITVDPTDFFG
jgi:rubredoxin